jgi:hypothetical protein
MTVVPFRRPTERAPQPAGPPRRTLGEFAIAMAMLGLGFFLLRIIWTSAPPALLAVINLVAAAVYAQTGPRIAASIWIALSLAALVLTGSPSPATLAIDRAAALLVSALGL